MALQVLSLLLPQLWARKFSIVKHHRATYQRDIIIIIIVLFSSKEKKCYLKSMKTSLVSPRDFIE